MFVMAVDDNKVTVTNPDNEWITSGSLKTNFVQFNFSEAWEGLKKTVIFQTEHCLIPILLEGDELTKVVAVPWECMVFVNDEIRVGAYGTREDDTSTEADEEIVLPTVWGVLPEKVRQGVIITEPIEPDPTYNAYLALLKVIEDLIKNGGGGGTAFEVNDTLVLSDGVLGLKTPIKPITSNEYDALTEEQKNSETAWLVTDANGSGSAPSIEEYDTDDGWHVRKWANGYVEQSCIKTVDKADTDWVQSGSGYLIDGAIGSIAAPVTFKKLYNIQMNVFTHAHNGRSYGAFIMPGAYSAVDLENFQKMPPITLMRFAKPIAGEYTYYVNYFATGTWK